MKLTAVSGNHNVHLILYTVMHFLVDLSCIFYLMGMIYVRLPGYEDWTRAAVLYNLFAFALPAVLGLIADIAGKNALVSSLGCLLILISYLFIPAPWTAVVLIGVGNGLFHIGGGRQILMDSVRPEGAAAEPGSRLRIKTKSGFQYAPSGIFISSGAFGVYLGRTLSGMFKQVFYVSLWILLAVCVVLLAWLGVLQWKDSIRSRLSRQKLSRGMLAGSLLIFLVVILRSYYGFVAVYSWNRTFLTGLLFTFCIVAGKFIGGIAADWIGVTAASLISLMGAGILALFAGGSPAAGCISILLFNMTMPITLTLLTDLWKELPGFAFGVLMLALFLGTLPSMVWKVRWMSSAAGQLGLCILSLVLLLAAIYMKERSGETGASG
ncbi:MAG: hypothetical protein IJ106_03650 [Parasporobacterium sp.]|nr:hypothetical protein [Parasporobacterium sp.]